jgi:hypothetical protein
LNLLAQLPDAWRRRLGSASAIILYLAAAYLLVGRGLLGDFTGRIVDSRAGHDPGTLVWCLAWFPHAIRNHLNLFLSRAVWWPDGVNLAWVPSIPGAALLAWPITSAFGPVASYNLLSFLALPAAAFTGFLLCRHLTGRNRASILGGYVFGFSPYFLGHLQNHLNLILAFPIPLAMVLVARFLEGRIRRRVFVPMLAVVVAIQFLFIMELFATMTAVGIVALLVGFAIGPEHWRIAIRTIIAPIASAYLMMAVLVAPYWYYLFAFRIPKSAMVSATAVSTDLLNFFVPADDNLFGEYRIFEAISSRFTFRAEAGGWIAWPLLIVVALYVQWRWRKPLGKVLILMSALLGVATLGPRLHVGGQVLFGLPWKIVEHIPLIRSALPARLTMYIFLIAGMMTAVVLADDRLPRAAKYAIVIAIVIFMQPNPDHRFWITRIEEAPFFGSPAMTTLLNKDETVVVLPYAGRADSMLWQAHSDFYFNMAGGYTGATMPDAFVQWPAVGALYWGEEIDHAEAQLGAFFLAHDVRHVIIPQLRVPEYAALLPALKDLSLARTNVEGAMVFTLATEQIAKYAGLKPIDLEREYDRDRFDRLLVAAQKYLETGAPPQSLSASAVARPGFIPRSWAVDQDIATKDGLILGPWTNDRIQVGVVGSYVALETLIADFRADAAEVYFPFPRRLEARPKGNTFMRKLVMVFDRAGLARAAAKASAEIAK